jgi:hypothetical protein
MSIDMGINQWQFDFECYYCSFKTNNERKYLSHGVMEHFQIKVINYPSTAATGSIKPTYVYGPKPMFPNEADLRKYSLKPQGKPWEYYSPKVLDGQKRQSLQVAWPDKLESKDSSEQILSIQLHQTGLEKEVHV